MDSGAHGALGQASQSCALAVKILSPIMPHGPLSQGCMGKVLPEKGEERRGGAAGTSPQHGGTSHQAALKELHSRLTVRKCRAFCQPIYTAVWER